MAESKEVRKFLTKSEKTADGQIKAFAKILQAENLPVPKSLETEVTISTDSPFSDRLLMYHMGFLFQAAHISLKIKVAFPFISEKGSRNGS